MTLLLERSDVEGLLDMKDAIRIVEAAFAEHGKRMAVSWAPTPFHITKGSLRVAVGALLENGVIGTRLGLSSAFKTGSLLAVVHDLKTGELAAVMSYPFTSFRMGAVCSLATKLLAREDSQAVGIIGTGRRAVSLLEGIVRVRPIKRIKAYSRDPDRRADFAKEASSILGVGVLPGSDVEELLGESDILVVSTSSQVPLFEPQRIKAGTHINSLGLPSELHPGVYRRADLTVVGSKHRKLTRQATNRVVESFSALGDVEILDNVIELSGVMAQQGGRKGKDEITVYRDGTAGWVDLALANWVLKRAIDRGLGKTVSF